MCVYVGFVMSGCFDNCAAVLVIYVLVFTVFIIVILCCLLFRLHIFILSSFVCTHIRITSTEWELNCSK